LENPIINGKNPGYYGHPGVGYPGYGVGYPGYGGYGYGNPYGK